MIFGRSKLELKVGIFVFMGLVILVGSVLLIGDFKTWTSGYNLKLTFNFINGVKIGAPVRFAGVDIGEVKEINFVIPENTKETKVQILAWIRNNARMPVDSTVWVNTLGLLGEKYIEIMPGTNYTKILANNDEVVGVDPIAMHEVAQLARSIAGDLDDIIIKIKNKEGTVGKLLFDDEIYKQLDGLVTDLRKNPWKIFWKTKEKK